MYISLLDNAPNYLVGYVNPKEMKTKKCDVKLHFSPSDFSPLWDICTYAYLHGTLVVKLKKKWKIENIIRCKADSY